MLCDSLYANRIAGDTSDLDDLQLQPFLDYAAPLLARRIFFSQLYPPEERYRGNTTTQTAEVFDRPRRRQKSPANGKTSRGTPIVYRGGNEWLPRYGYAGMTNQDHFDHLFAMHDLMKQTSIADAK